MIRQKKFIQHHIKFIAIFGIFGAASVFISGCTELQLGNHVFKKAAYKPAPNHAPPITGPRKIGNPYTIMGVTYYPISSSEGYHAKGVASWYGSDFHGKKTANGETYNMHALTAAHPTLPLPTWVRVTNLENGLSVRLRVNDRGPFLRGRLIDLSYRAAQVLDIVEDGTAPVLVEALPTNGTALLTQDQVQLAAAASRKREAMLAERQKSAGIFTNRIVNRENGEDQNDTYGSYLPPKQPATTVSAKTDPPPLFTETLGQGGGLYIPPLAAEEKLPPHPTVKPVVLNQVALYIQTGAFSSAENAEKQKEEVKKYYPTAFTMPVTKEGRTLSRVRVGPIHSVKEADEILAKLVATGFNTAIITVD